MPALKQVEEEVPNRWVDLLELVYEDDPGFAGLDFQGELALFAADVAARASDERVEGVFAAVVAEVDLREGLARGEQAAEDAGRLGLADAGRAEQEHGQYRLLADGVEQPEDSDLLAKLLFERTLANEVTVEVVKELSVFSLLRSMRSFAPRSARIASSAGSPSISDFSISSNNVRMSYS